MPVSPTTGLLGKSRANEAPSTTVVRVPISARRTSRSKWKTPQTVEDGLTQLRGYRGPVYIAGSNQEAVERVLEATERTTVGVMNRRGEILKSSSRSW